MKTVKKGNAIKRVANKIGATMVKNQNWLYCPKSEYKAKVKGYIEEAKKEEKEKSE